MEHAAELLCNDQGKHACLTAYDPKPSGSKKVLSPLELLGAVDGLVAKNAAGEAISLYRTWIDENPGEPLLYAMTFNCGMLLSNSGEFAAARETLKRCIELNQDFLPAQINLGLVLEKIGAVSEAIMTWQQVITRLQNVNGETLAQKRTTLRQLGRVLESAHLDPAAESVLRQSLEIDSSQRDVVQHWLSLRQRQCEWPVAVAVGDLRPELILDNLPPLTLAAILDDPLAQLHNADEYCTLDIPQPKSEHAFHALPTDGTDLRPLRIGYLSSDLREHAVGYLVAEIFGLHDHAQTKIFVYYCGHAVADGLHHRIKTSVDEWRDISGLDDTLAAKLIADDQIDIIVDLNGHTHGARTSLLGLRPAPIIVNWLGYPGTTGSRAHDYIIADSFIIPPQHEIYYSEAVARLPCYQPNDRCRESAGQMPSRQDVSLPEDAVVYCCFNGAQKFTRFTWGRWMTILRLVPESVLWLMQGVATTNDRLRELAANQGISPDRLIFAERRSNQDHLVRYKLADLFLDTMPYNAHTTASDALWMGLPIVTLAGRSFASRVCGSLVTSAGLGELVCTTEEQYIALAVELGRDRERLLSLRRRLEVNRDSCILFDTPSLVRELERVYRDMWRTRKEGRQPHPDLSAIRDFRACKAAVEGEQRELVSRDYRAQYNFLTKPCVLESSTPNKG